MRTHVVRPNETPASIAILYAGCPKCSKDLGPVNRHKATVTHPNGYTTFRDLRVGETLNLPEKWFDGSLDARPNSYFAALPYHDGVTPSKLGLRAAGILGDYNTLDQATVLVGTLPAMDNSSFSAAVPQTAALLDSSVKEADGSSNTTAASNAQDVHRNTGVATAQNAVLAAAITASDQNTATSARLDIQNAFSEAVSNANIALQALYGDQPAGTSPATPPASATPPVPAVPPPASTATFPTTVITAAQAAAAAISANSNYCAAVAQNGSAVNSAVHAFKTAWNGTQTPPVPVGTGNYEQATAVALARVLGPTAPAACPVRTTPPIPTTPAIPPLLAVTPPVQQKSLSVGAVAGIGLIGAGIVGGAIYLATHKRTTRKIKRKIKRAYRGAHRRYDHEENESQ